MVRDDFFTTMTTTTTTVTATTVTRTTITTAATTTIAITIRTTTAQQQQQQQQKADENRLDSEKMKWTLFAFFVWKNRIKRVKIDTKTFYLSSFLGLFLIFQFFRGHKFDTFKLILDACIIVWRVTFQWHQVSKVLKHVAVLTISYIRQIVNQKYNSTLWARYHTLV